MVRFWKSTHCSIHSHRTHSRPAASTRSRYAAARAASPQAHQLLSTKGHAKSDGPILPSTEPMGIFPTAQFTYSVFRHPATVHLFVLTLISSYLHALTLNLYSFKQASHFTNFFYLYSSSNRHPPPSRCPQTSSPFNQNPHAILDLTWTFRANRPEHLVRTSTNMPTNLPSSFASAAAGQNANRDSRGGRSDGRGVAGGDW